jgi:hypothetical protein
MIRAYWRQVGGTLIEEFPAVCRTATCGQRLLDALILPDGKTRIAGWREIALEGEDVIVVQAKAHRLGMYLMGQTFFSAQLLDRFKPASITSVALCTRDDTVLRLLLEQHPGMKVVVLDMDEGHLG